MLRQLATCKWVHDHRNVIVTGATGVGKTYVACALAQQCCRKGLRVLYRRVPRLLDELALARADGTYPRLLTKLSRYDVLVLDDWGLAKLTDAARHDILEMLEDRYDLRSTIVASQMPVKQWHEYIEDPSLADALLDRVVHNAYKLDLKGDSLRKKRQEDPKLNGHRRYAPRGAGAHGSSRWLALSSYHVRTPFLRTTRPRHNKWPRSP